MIAAARRDPEMDERIVRFVGAWARERGYPPTVREVAAAAGLASPSSAHRKVARLVREGRLAREPGKTRTLRVVE